MMTGKKQYPKKLGKLDPARFEANPDAYFPGEDLEDAGVRSVTALERDRWAGIGIPYTKVGRRVFYLGSDVLEFIKQGRVETEAAA